MDAPQTVSTATQLTEALNALSGLNFSKGHGTGNDFVLVEDRDDQLNLSEFQVRALCDRHLGIGGDGLIRVVASQHIPEGQRILQSKPEASWFMDYRNSDGSIAEMCGNGVRVFVHYLVQKGLIQLDLGESVSIGTRAGLKTVHRMAGGYAIAMGPWTYIYQDEARAHSSDSMVSAEGVDAARPALSISMGNPHTVVALSSLSELDGLNLHQRPHVDPEPDNGTNVEFVVPSDPLVQDGIGHVTMRVHERGVGETLSCGTGACAVAAALRVWAGSQAVSSWTVDLPGGSVQVDFVPTSDGAEHVVLGGPAELVYSGTL